MNCRCCDGNSPWKHKLIKHRYHHLNHHAMFGGYKSSAMGIMRKLERKYGRKGVN
jgi:hypothetical protein